MSLSDLLTGFTNIVDKILAVQDKKSFLSNNEIKESYENYKKALGKSDPLDHQEFFHNSYSRNKTEILKDLNDDWLKNSNVFIQLNEGSQKENRKYRINLSQIYKISLQERKEILAKIGTSPNADMPPEVQYPELFLLNYYKVIHYYLENSLDGTVEKEEAKALNNIIFKFEVNLGMKEMPKEKETPEKINVDGVEMNTETLFDNAADAIQNIDINGMLNKLKKNKKVAGFIGNVAGKMKGRVGKQEDLMSFLMKDGMNILGEAVKTFNTNDFADIIPGNMMGKMSGANQRSQTKQSQSVVVDTENTPEPTQETQGTETVQEPTPPQPQGSEPVKSLIDFDD